MSQSETSPRDTLQSWNEDGSLYAVVGVVSAILSLVFIPLFGLLAVYCGYKLYDAQQRRILAILMVGFGGFGFLSWVYYLTTL